MFGLIHFRTKVMVILHHDFDYVPAVPGWQSPMFNKCTKKIKKVGGNEYDAAISFMMSIVQALVEGGEEVAERLQCDEQRFKDRVNCRALELAPKAKALRYQDIMTLIEKQQRQQS